MSPCGLTRMTRRLPCWQIVSRPSGEEGQPVRAGLVVAADVRARVPALRAEHGHRAILPAVDRVRIRRAEQQRTVRGPDGSLRELETAGDALERALCGQDPAEVACDLERSRPGDGRAFGGVEVQRRGAHPDVVARRGRDRPVDAEDRDGEGLAGLGVTSEHYPVGCIEAADRTAARVADRDRQLAVHPDLGVVVDHDLEDDGRAGRVEVADPLGDRDVDFVPVEADAAVGEAQLRLRRGSGCAAHRRARRRRCGSGGARDPADPPASRVRRSRSPRPWRRSIATGRRRGPRPPRSAGRRSSRAARPGAREVPAAPLPG